LGRELLILIILFYLSNFRSGKNFPGFAEYFTATLFSEHCNQPFMDMPGDKRLLIIILLIVIAVAVAIVLSPKTLGPDVAGGTGTLTGNVSIGPLCPVEPCMVPPDRLTAAYAARTIVVSDTGGSVIATTAPDPYDGYSFRLKPGIYIIDIRHQGIDRSPDLPETVTISAGETVTLDITIDTGIR
jgi:hypothetical protein